MDKRKDIEDFLLEQGISIGKKEPIGDDGLSYWMRVNIEGAFYLHSYFEAENYEKALQGGLHCLLYHHLGKNLIVYSDEQRKDSIIMQAGKWFMELRANED